MPATVILQATGRARAGGAAAWLALALAATIGVAPSIARADAERSVVHPIYAQVPDAPQNDLALKRFTTATLRLGLGPIEIVDVEGDPAPNIAPKLGGAIDLVRKLDFGAARTLLDDLAAVVAATGGGGLDAGGLSDLFLYRAWAISRADFNTEHVPTPTARAEAYADLTRAVMLVPGRQLNLQQYPPFLLEDWTRAAAEVAAREQTTLSVRAAPEARVTCDGGAPLPGPATFVGLARGEHLIHVDEPGWAAWGATISVEGPSVDVSPPVRRALTLGDAGAAARARRMGMKFALVAEPRPGQDRGLSLNLRLVDAAGVRRDAAIELLAGDGGALDAAVMRLDEQARRLDRGGATPMAPAVAATAPEAAMVLSPAVLVAPSPARPRLGENPGAWARDHWPLLTAVGAMVGTAVVLSIAVAGDRPVR
jgi:hypothetical protein